MVTTRITRVEGEPFKSEGRVMVNPGWLAVYGREAETGEAPTLAPVPDGKVATREVEVKAEQTRPPARYSEATLLSAMEGAGKLVEDDELREAMSEKGLGTPATRAAVIEGLIFEDYLHRNGRELQPTAKAFDLLYALSRFGVDELRSPELTGDWEFKLKQMEQGRLRREEFMRHIVETTQDLVNRIKSGTTIDEPLSTLAEKCPKCGGTVRENYKKFQCASCDFSMWKVIASRRIENEEAEQLFRERSIGPLQNFRSRMGRPFAAMLKLKDDHSVELDFGQSAADEREAEPVDFSGRTPLGACPKCGAQVYDHELAYVCEKSVGPARACDFRTGKIILQRPIEPEQVVKLLATGRTDLLHRFISKKGRPFSAFLVRQPDGRIGFEFAPREAKAKKAPAKKPAVRSEAQEPPPPRYAPPAAPAETKPARAGAKKAAPAKRTAVKKSAARAAAPGKTAAKKPAKRAAK
jgi:DNA topoisomerase-3